LKVIAVAAAEQSPKSAHIAGDAAKRRLLIEFPVRQCQFDSLTRTETVDRGS